MDGQKIGAIMKWWKLQLYSAAEYNKEEVYQTAFHSNSFWRLGSTCFKDLNEHQSDYIDCNLNHSSALTV
jgi:hypothetical protein